MSRGVANFTRAELAKRLDAAVGKTLGEVDTAGVFTKDRPHKGMAGAVIEQSVLGYGANSDRAPDIVVDGVEVEVKTTGVRKTDNHYHAKEYLAVTNVSIDKIVDETYDDSAFWHKLARVLYVFYHYDSEKKVPYKEYARFKILGYLIESFTDEQKAELKREWELVKQFIIEAKASSDPEKVYPLLGQSLREQLRYIDTGPRYPNNPRFRLKTPFLNMLIDRALSPGTQETLPVEINSYADIDKICNQASKLYKGKKIKQIATELGIVLSSDRSLPKNIMEMIIIRMFGGTGTSISNITQFMENGVIGKTICIDTDGLPKEDTKYYSIDFDEMLDESVDFDESILRNYFADSMFLFAITERQNKGDSAGEYIFKGFKRIAFDYDFIEKQTYGCWNDVRTKYFSGTLKTEVKTNPDGTPRLTPTTGLPVRETNFPKSSEFDVFIKGTGNNAKDRKEILPGVIDYSPVQIWVSKKRMNVELGKKEYL